MELITNCNLLKKVINYNEHLVYNLKCCKSEKKQEALLYSQAYFLLQNCEDINYYNKVTKNIYNKYDCTTDSCVSTIILNCIIDVIDISDNPKCLSELLITELI